MTSWEHDLAELVRVRGGAMVGYAYLLCQDRSEAADLVQEALVSVFSRLKGPPRAEIGDLEGYVKRAISRKYLDRQRREIRLRQLLPFLHEPPTVDQLEEEVLAQETFDRALKRLSPSQRVALSLRFYEDMTTLQISVTMRCSEGHVKRLLSDARSRLQNNTSRSRILGGIDNA